MTPSEHATELIALHPDLAPQVRAGLILALAGRVREPLSLSNGTRWLVKAETSRAGLCKEYTIYDMPTIPRRWSCNCEQGRSFGPTTGDFDGLAGRICKHVAAVALCCRTGQYPAPPASVWDLFCRLVEGGSLDHLGRKEEVPLPGPHGLRVIRPTGETMVLARGRTRSEALAVRSRAGWQVPEWGRGHYDSFVERIRG